jgi:acetoacetate decarboxylase
MITGAPTKIGEITLDKKAQSIKATAARNGKVLFQATMTLGEEGEPLDNAPVVNLKVIPGEKKDAPLLRQLIGGKIENIKVHELIDGECKFEFASSPADGFPEVPVQQIFRSFYRKADFTLTGAGVLYDYLKKN